MCIPQIRRTLYFQIQEMVKMFLLNYFNRVSIEQEATSENRLAEVTQRCVSPILKLRAGGRHLGTLEDTFLLCEEFLLCCSFQNRGRKAPGSR